MHLLFWKKNPLNTLLLDTTCTQGGQGTQNFRKFKSYQSHLLIKAMLLGISLATAHNFTSEICDFKNGRIDQL